MEFFAAFRFVASSYGSNRASL